MQGDSNIETEHPTCGPDSLGPSASSTPLLLPPLTASHRASMGYFADLRASLRAFTTQERRNIAIYVIGIMVYKFGLEAFNGSILSLAANRYDYEAIRDNKPSRTFERVGLLTGLNQAFQCVGSILIGPLVRAAVPLSVSRMLV